jgi:hypothetical protein
MGAQYPNRLQHQETGLRMSNRLDSLRQRHALLERRLQAELARPLPDQMELRRIKAEKLRLKDKMLRLTSPPSATRMQAGEMRAT